MANPLIRFDDDVQTFSDKVNKNIADMTARLNAFVAAFILFVGLVLAVVAVVSDQEGAVVIALGIVAATVFVTISVCGLLAVLLDIRATNRMLALTMRRLAESASGQDSSSTKKMPISTGKGGLLGL